MPDGAARIIARNGIDATADQFGHVKRVFQAANDVFGRARSGFEKEVAVPDARVAGDAARGVAGGGHAEFVGGVGVEQIAAEHAVFDDGSAPRGHAFVVERRGAEEARNGAVVDERDVLRGDLFAQLPARNDALR